MMSALQCFAEKLSSGSRYNIRIDGYRTVISYPVTSKLWNVYMHVELDSQMRRVRPDELRLKS